MKKVILGTVLFTLSGRFYLLLCRISLQFFKRSWFGAKSGHYGAGAEY
ncbi:hypothetical protein YM80_003035 [Salmonella enterica subsp. salamae]|nr:hypothetical protein [Salmonella enterica subsp. salamae]